MKTAQEYLDSIRRLRFNVYILGEKVDQPADHPLVTPSQTAVAKTYEMAEKEEHRDLFQPVSHVLTSQSTVLRTSTSQHRTWCER